MKYVFVLVAVVLSACAVPKRNICEHVQCITAKATTVDMLESEHFQRTAASTVLLYSEKEWRDGNTLHRAAGAGCGVVLKKNRIVTTYHLVRNAEGIWAQTWSVGPNGEASPSGKSVWMEVVHVEKDLDLAVLEPSESLGAQPIQIADKPVKTGDPVWRLGCATGWNDGFVRNTEAPVPPLGNLMEVRMTTKTGNSGSAVVNENGALVGIQVAGSEKLELAYSVDATDIRRILKK